MINLRSLRPLDVDTIVTSVKKTNRFVSVEEGWPVASVGVGDGGAGDGALFDYLDAPVTRVSRRRRADALRGQPREAGVAAAGLGRPGGQSRLLSLRRRGPWLMPIQVLMPRFRRR